MTRDQAQELLETYKNFPKSKLFSLRPINYPIFHLLESFVKGWRIETWAKGQMIERNDVDFEGLAARFRTGEHDIWRYIARNPQLTNTTTGFVQEDLYARYMGKCTPLRGPLTTWTFIPFSIIEEIDWRFQGLIGKHTKLYQIEIDLNTTDIIGKRQKNLPWHYLQQTLDWKPWTGRIDWNEADQPQEPQTEITRENLRDRFNRLRMTI